MSSSLFEMFLVSFLVIMYVFHVDLMLVRIYVAMFLLVFVLNLFFFFLGSRWFSMLHFYTDFHEYLVAKP